MVEMCSQSHPALDAQAELAMVSAGGVLVHRPTYLRLHHGRALCAQGLHRLEHVHHTLVAHPLQDDAQSDEHPGAAHASTA